MHVPAPAIDVRPCAPRDLRPRPARRPGVAFLCTTRACDRATRIAGRALALLALLACAAPQARAQVDRPPGDLPACDLAGPWEVSGRDAALGDVSGRVELVELGAPTEPVRRFALTGRLTLAGETCPARGEARSRAGDLVRVRLQVRRTAGTPPASVGLAGALGGMGGGSGAPTAATSTSLRGWADLRVSLDGLTVTGAYAPAPGQPAAGVRTGAERWRRLPRPGHALIKVMTFNIKGQTRTWPARAGRIGALIREEPTRP
jgi:hypothetical protein